MKMKTIAVAALAAAQLTAAAAPARAADLPVEEAATQQRPASAAERLREDVKLGLDPGQAAKPGAGDSPMAVQAAEDREEEPRKKRKSTGDKVLTGAAVVLGIGALAVGGLLVALFVG
jgi:hypothetical protein